jgi:N-acetylmuramate 1-kinase
MKLEQVRHGINSFEGDVPDQLSCAPLAGDASDRRYFRAHYSTGSVSKSVVVMDILDVQNACKSEEVTLYHDDAGELPFLNIHRFLEWIGAPVPAVLYFNREWGLMLLEDLGDRLLLDEVESGEPGAIRRLYGRAIEVLVRMQVNAEAEKDGSDCMAFEQSFAPELLAWEFEHYLEYGIEALHQVKIEPEDRALLKAMFNRISSKIASLPRVFTHRDFHARNLLVKSEHIYLIDFQDALHGPQPYDLASLIRDSYIDLGAPMREELLELYVDVWNQVADEPLDPKTFKNDFALVAMQRNLKAAGRFVFIDKVKGNPAYLASIPRTLGYVAQDLATMPELEAIAEILINYEPRLAR